MKDKEWETADVDLTYYSSETDNIVITGEAGQMGNLTLTPHVTVSNASNKLIVDSSNPTYTLTIPTIVGRYVISEGLHFTFTRKPNWFHRIMVRLLLGWEWQDELKNN
jgi:hypothetical protein